ncbi:hypothetical protein GUJ93_ZPchr0001g30067 [Zizania palustris]|uniref:Uncharacterized protein n=1 Tax=Zizania palustris TaxID=103762 RepID=A0A8J5RRM1_ZIZPA|nr:hypothetical protein GUJ93_ZPchr0001g30067 [Zizania palustris]
MSEGDSDLNVSTSAIYRVVDLLTIEMSLDDDEEDCEDLDVNIIGNNNVNFLNNGDNMNMLNVGGGVHVSMLS